MMTANLRKLDLFALVLALACLPSCGQHEKADDDTRSVQTITAPSGDEPTATEADFALPEQRDKDDIYDVTPTVDETDSSKYYIPSDLDDCFVELDRMLHPKLIEELTAGGDRVANKQHFGLGLWMRNNWGLWANSRLAEYFRGIGILHPDDMSGIILTSYIRHLNKQPVKLQAQIKYYQDYWTKQIGRPRRGFIVRGQKKSDSGK